MISNGDSVISIGPWCGEKTCGGSGPQRHSRAIT